ncbi:MAG: DsrE family protein [Desulfarculaceae bacterium]|jgi:predicted peroxiredoxin
MAKFLFVLSRGLEDPTRATRCFQFAKLAKEDGNEVTVFLIDDAVIFARLGAAEHVKAPTSDELKPYLDYLIENKTPIMVCTPCANNRLIDPEDFVEGARLETGKTLIELAKEAKVFTF